MKYLVKCLLLIVCFLFVPLSASSYPSYGYVVPTMVEGGLRNSTIYDIHYGNKGYVWFTTDLGICRYDGFRVRSFPLISCRNAAFPVSNAVVSVTQAPDSLLYLQLMNGGIACFDPDEEKYLPVSWDNTLNGMEVLSFYMPDEGQIYVGTSGGLYKGTVSHEEGIVIRLSGKPLLEGEVTMVSGIGKQSVFACVNRTKVAVYRTDTHALDFPGKSGNSEITELYGHGGYLWICSSSGVDLYDLKRKKLAPIRETGEDRSRMEGARVVDIVSAGDRSYYVATYKGLFLLKFGSKELTDADCRVNYVEPSYSSGIGSRVMSLKWQDDQKILWIGTSGTGLYRMYGMENTFCTLTQTFGTEIRRIEEDVKGYVWVLTDIGELWRSTTAGLSVGTSFRPWTKGLKDGESYRMKKDATGHLWLGDSHGGIICITPSTEEVTSFKLEPEGTTDFSEPVQQLCLDSRNRMWIATSNHFVLLDRTTGKSKILPLEYGVRKIKKVSSIAEDKEGNIWLGTDAGLKRLDMQETKISLLGAYEQDAGLDVSQVYSIYVNGYNQILVSYSDKILRVDGRDKGKVDGVFTLLNGLCSSHVHCMIDDENGNTWIGTESGVMTIRNDKKMLYNYASFGLSNEVCRLHDGRLLWANSLGLTFFDPLTVKAERSGNKVLLTEAWMNGEVLPSSLTSIEAVEGDDLAFYFSDLEYSRMQRRLSYRLLPDEEWKTRSLEDGITFRRLSAGDYTLQVKLLYPDAEEGAVLEIPVVVKASWWNSVGAKLCYCFAVFGLILAVYYYVERKGRAREVIRNREIELRETLNLTRMEQEQKNKMDIMRNQLLTAFMEELRTPLSLIIAPLKELSRETGLSSGILSKLQVAYRNSLGMLNSCNQLLAVYTQGSLSDKLEAAPYSVERLIDRTVFGVSELMRLNQIELKYDKKISKGLDTWGDSKQIGFLMHNLLSNAFNHVRLSGVIRLVLQEREREGVCYCVIIVADNGTNRIRSESKMMEDQSWLDLTDIELGYDTMEKIAQLHHGTISMNSAEGEGTEIVVELPVGREVMEGDPNVVFIEQESEEEDTADVSLLPDDGSSQGMTPAEEASVSGESQRTATAQEDENRKTLLIVEDHKDIRLYLKVIFGKEYNLLFATNGQEGIDTAVEGQPDLVLCDVMMPVKDGFECCRELKEGLSTCHIPIIMLTAKVEDDDILHGLELGADDYVLKPFTPGILQAKVRNLINARVLLKRMYANILMTPESEETDETEIEEEKKMEDPFIASVVKIVEDNMCEADFNVKKLAAELNMSQPTLYRKVKQSTDFTIIELIRGVRMRKAAVLLKQKVYAVQEVAEMVGYNDIPTFRKHFVDAFGTTPSTYSNSDNP